MVADSFVLHSDIGTPTTKDLILSILVKNWPISAHKIYNKVIQRKSVTYKTVHKALQELRASRIIVKKEQGYLLDLKWLHTLKGFANVAEKYYYKKSEFFKLMALTDENTYAIAKQFKTMADLNDFMLDYVEEERESAYSISNHLWFPIFHNKRVIEHANKLALYGKKLNAVCGGRTPVDRYCVNYLKSVGGNAVFGKQASRNISFDVFGDNIVQTLYPDDIVRKIDSTYEKHGRLESIATPEFFNETLLKRTKIPVVIVQSKTMADMLRKNIQNMLGSN